MSTKTPTKTPAKEQKERTVRLRANIPLVDETLVRRVAGEVFDWTGVGLPAAHIAEEVHPDTPLGIPTDEDEAAKEGPPVWGTSVFVENQHRKA